MFYHKRKTGFPLKKYDMPVKTDYLMYEFLSSGDLPLGPVAPEQLDGLNRMKQFIESYKEEMKIHIKSNNANIKA